ncbi:MAG: tetratricopeptide repeat protein [Planctomycetota bacterium]|nr:tetratricopeptide repeat protein [Planctomycetota bacterium]
MRIVCRLLLCVPLLVLANAARLESGEAVPELAKIAKPAEYDLLSPKLTAEQFQAFVQRADKGDPFAQDALFFAAYCGFGTKADPAQVREYHTRAYKSGAPLATVYEARNLEGFPLNPKRNDPQMASALYMKALQFFMPLAQAGSPMAMHMVAVCKIGMKDQKSAVDWYEKAAAAGNVNAMLNLGRIHVDRGRGLNKARELFEQAAAQGYTLANIELARFHLDDSYPGTDPSVAFKICKDASSDNAEACCLLAQMYLGGLGVTKDVAEGLRLLDAATTLGKVKVAVVGLRCESQKDYKTARAVYERGAKNKEAPSMWRLGYLCNRGLGGPVDHDRAFLLLRAAADGQLLNAWDDLAWHYQTGKGTPKNPKEAFRWLAKSAEMAKMRHSSVPLCRLGLAYAKGIGTPVDTAKGLALINEAANAGCLDASNALGVIYRQGLYGVKKDLGVSASWYRKAVEEFGQREGDEGAKEGVYRYALCLRNGWGVPQNLPESAKCLKVAATEGAISGEGLADAQTQLGVAYRDGIGVQPDLAEAFKWFQQAANRNHAEGLRCLSWMYREGEGVAKDVAEADKLLQRAEEQTRQDLADELDDLPPPPMEGEMTF